MSEDLKKKNFFTRIFIDGFSGMALGLFSTLIIGLIIKQIGNLFPQNSFLSIAFTLLGSLLTILTGAGIGCGVAHSIGAPKLVVYSCITAGMIGAWGAGLLELCQNSGSGSLMVGSAFKFSGPGDPLGAFLASVVAAEIGRIISGKTKVDILIIPFTVTVIAMLIGLTIAPPLSRGMNLLGSFINRATELQPFFMGIVVSVTMGILLTLPISSAAIAIVFGLSGLAGGAATAGCSAQMIGFAVISFADNRFNGLISQGLGTSMLQIPNIIKKPIIWLPVILASAITGPLSSCVFKMKTLSGGAGMGTSGLVGQIMTYSAMIASESGLSIIIKILVNHFIIPAILSYAFYLLLKKKGLIKSGDMKIKW